jgi:hypothetical protein
MKLARLVVSEELTDGWKLLMKRGKVVFVYTIPPYREQEGRG